MSDDQPNLSELQGYPNIIERSRNLRDALTQADRDLHALEPQPFSPKAFEAVSEKIAEYITDLVTESAREAKRQQLDTISENHVERAANYLVSATSKKGLRNVGTVGGIFLGASLGNLLTLASSPSISFLSVGLTTAFAILGAFAIAFQIAKD